MNTVVFKLKATVILILAVACIILWMQTTGLAHQMIYYVEKGRCLRAWHLTVSILFLIIGLSYRSRAVVGGLFLTSSLDKDGRNAACPEELVTFKCTVIQGATLEWIIQPFIVESDPITFLSIDSVGYQVVRGVFRATLTNVTQNPDNMILADMTSKVTVIASPDSLNGAMVECFDQRTRVSKQLTITGRPSPPKNLTYMLTECTPINSTVLFNWDHLQDDEVVDNYTVSVNSHPASNVSFSVVSSEAFAALNSIYTVSVIATNCAGTSEASRLEIGRETTKDCGVPLPPRNGSILNVNYQSTTVGSQVFYQCNSGMIPSGRMRSFCTLDEGWSPNPVLVVCRVPADCGDPDLPVNVSTNVYNSTLEGTELFYHCNPGLVPEGQIRAVCTANGSWIPSPADLVCTKPLPVDCGDPLPVDTDEFIEIYNDSITPGSSVMYVYHCHNGVVHMRARCAEDGMWTTNPAELMCIRTVEETMSSQSQFNSKTSEITVICTAAAAAFLSFTFGVVTGGAAYYCISARKKKDYRPCTAEHEQQLNSLTPQTAEIELNQNVAYEAVLPSDII